MAGATTDGFRVVVVEDEPLFRELVASAVGAQSGITVVGTFGSGRDAVLRGQALAPDVALLDIELGEGDNGVEVGLELRRALPHLGVVLLSSHADPEILSSLPASEAGGWSYLLKNSVQSIDSVTSAIRGAAEGRLTVDPQLTARRTVRPATRTASLTKRQLEILRLLSEGLSNAAIADRLVLAPKSVENHINMLYARLGVDASDRGVAHRVQAARIYLEETFA